MTRLRFGPLLAIGGAACLVAWTPEGRTPPNPDIGAPPAWNARVDDAPTETASIPRPARAGRPSPGGERAAPASIPAPPLEAALSDADIASQFAGASLEGAAPAPAAPSAPAPPAELVSREPTAPVMAPEPPSPAASPDLPALAPPISQAAVLYQKGDAAGLAALAASADDPAERTALEWASLRADAHPSFASLAAFLEAHPRWPSRSWIRERQEAELAAHPPAPADVAAFFAAEPAQTSAGRLAAARADEAMGRADEAAQGIRALWRDGNFDGFTESVILRDFGGSLLKADHTYRAERLFYAGYFSASARAAALAGPDVLALAQARFAAARAPMSAALVRAVPPALRNDPGLLFSRIQYARRAGRIYEAAVMLSLAPRDRDALVNRDRWWSERKMVARALLDLDEPRLAFEVCDGTVRPDSSEARVDAAFHAGWIALRFLDDAPSAARRFAVAAEAAENPLSVARAAYWQGRAAEAMGDSAVGQGLLRPRRQRADRLLWATGRAASRRDPSRPACAASGGRGRSARRGGARG